MSEETRPDYRDTVFLPKTDFPMKAGLPQKEPAILQRWEAGSLYARLREARAGREKFILHDGPPYANGDMHIGHALNHILKDMVCRTQSLLGKDAPYVPGWDCHGLPIEWKVEEQYRKKKLNKDEVPTHEFRAECRAYAQHWVNVQREQVKRLGVLGNWDKPYLTMDFDSEATIVAELLKVAASGQLYRGAKPVMWSPVEKTALAEAEIEYEDIVSTQIDVAFEIVEAPNAPELVGAFAVVWTTTPWTIPANQAIAYGPDVEYGAYWMTNGDRTILVVIAEQLATDFQRRTGLRNEDPDDQPHFRLKCSDLAGAVARHPMAKLFQPSPVVGEGAECSEAGEGSGSADNPSPGADAPPSPARGEGIDRASPLAEFFLRPRPFLAGDFVTTDSGTGLVHMAPDHGEDDFDLCKRAKELGWKDAIDPVFAVEADGKYRADWAWLGGQGSVINPKFNAPDGPICSDLRAAGALLAASADYQHSYPHSWRSKAKVIFRCTPQWFVPMDRPIAHLPAKTPAEKRWENEGGAVDPADEVRCASPSLREAALAAIADTRFVPDKGRNRIGSMVEGRPDWVLSRQRAWGVPITLFVDRKTGQYLNDPEVNARIVAAVKEEGVDAWDASRAQDYLGDQYHADDFEQVTDILDVWFDSGCTHVFTLESGKWPELRWPADLYLEGSDQHRGWFQSSLLQSCATRGRAPYDAVLTHGFTMDAKGMKMSKSVGNTVDPLKVMETNGADIIRLWALSVDFTEDHRIGDEILKGVADQYRKLRNTFRYLLGALDGFGEEERVRDVTEMPELERYVLHLLADMDAKLRQAVEDFDFNSYVRLLSDFANNDLSAFFFDIRKDSLYCDAATSLKRRSYRTVLDILFHALVRYAAPVIVFTAEEVWQTRYPDAGSVHLLEWPEVHAGWVDVALASKWSHLRGLRARVLEPIEAMRRDRLVGSSLEAVVELRVRDALLDERANSIDFSEVCIAANVDVHGFADDSIDDLYQVTFSGKTTHHKCGRCWRHLPEVAEDGALCGRCAEVLA